MKKGLFIVLEGLDGSGKGTQMARLEQWLREQGRQVLVTAEPTASALGGLIRDSLAGLTPRSAEELSALFSADRIAHCANPKTGIKAVLQQGIDVLCDRYYYSSFAYQGRLTDRRWVMDMNLSCPEILRPDLCLFLDVPPEVGEERLARGRVKREIYETLEQQTAVRSAFLEVFDLLRERDRIALIQADRPAEEVSQEMIRQVSALLQEEIRK